MKKFFIFLAVFLSILAIIIFAGAAYLGFIPSISDKTIKRVDLGVKNNPKLNQELAKEVGFTNNISTLKNPTKSDFRYEGKLDIERTVTSEQVTSQFNAMSKESYYTPFTNVQVRFNPDGTTETSLDLDIDLVTEVAKQLGYSQSDIDKAKQYVNILTPKVYLYSKFSTEVTDNQITINPNSLQIQNINVPEQFLNPIADVVISIVETKMSTIPNLNVESLKQEGDKMIFKGTIPQSISIDD